MSHAMSVDQILRVIDDDLGAEHLETSGMWDVLEARLSSHPEEARIILENENLPLHSACYVMWHTSARPSSIRALVAAYPQALGVKNVFGYFPCHCACRQRSIDVFRLILRGYTAAAGDRNNRYQQLPHHLAAMCNRADLCFLWELLLVNPLGATTENGEGMTPLRAMWMHNCFRDNAGALLEDMSMSSVPELLLSPKSVGTALVGDVASWRDHLQPTAMGVPLTPEAVTWAKVELLLMAAHHGSVNQKTPSLGEIKEMTPSLVTMTRITNNGDRFLACHAAVGTGAPPVVVKLAMNLYPEQLHQKDANGRLPMHLAAGVGNVSTIACHMCSSWEDSTTCYVVEKEEIRCTLCTICYEQCLSFAVSKHYSASVGLPLKLSRRSWVPWLTCADVKDMKAREVKHTVTMLLDAYPEAVSIADDRGRLPLHHAASTGDLNRCVMPLVSAFPDAIEIPDPKTRLVPFQIAASAPSIDTSLERLDIVYTLLRMNPSYVKHVPSKRRKRKEP